MTGWYLNLLRRSGAFQDLLQRRRRAPEGQVADVEMPDPGGFQHANRSGADLLGGVARAKLPSQLLRRNRQEALQRLQRAAVGRPVVEDAEHPWKRQAAPRRLLEKRCDFGLAVVR